MAENSPTVGCRWSPEAASALSMATLTAREYEGFVAEVLSQLEFSDRATIFQNRRFEGVRQSGRYEVDVAVEYDLGPLLFLLIVECKKWKRPVDRAVVQKIAQTRDAIAAHKAAVVSPIGFSTEASDVAAELGVALWVISAVKWDVVMAKRHVSGREWRWSQRRHKFLDEVLRFRGSERVDDAPILREFGASRPSGLYEETAPRFVHRSLAGSAAQLGYSSPHLAPGDAVSGLVDEMMLLHRRKRHWWRRWQ